MKLIQKNLIRVFMYGRGQVSCNILTAICMERVAAEDQNEGMWKAESLLMRDS